MTSKYGIISNDEIREALKKIINYEIKEEQEIAKNETLSKLGLKHCLRPI